MNELRVILLLLGIAIIAGVYFWTRFKQRPRQVPAQRRTPVRRAVPDELDAAAIEQELTRMGQLLAEEETPDSEASPAEPAPPGPDAEVEAPLGEQLVVVSVVAEPGAEFEGEARPQKGIRVGYLQQEPQLDESLDVRTAVEQGVGETMALLSEFNAIAPHLIHDGVGNNGFALVWR